MSLIAKPKKNYLSLWTFIILLFFSQGLQNVFPVANIGIIKAVPLPSTVFARKIVADKINGSDEEAESLLPDVYYDIINDRVINFFMEKKNDKIKYYFSLDSGMDFSRVTEGSCEITRRISGQKKSGVEELRFYIKNSADSFVSITSGKVQGESLLSITLYGYLMQHDIKVPFALGKLIDKPFSMIRERTLGYVNWGFYLPDPDYIYSDDVRSLAERVLSTSRFLHDAEDGAMNASGTYVYIDTLKPQKGAGGLNCSGFAKWVVDGLYYSKGKTFLHITDLKRKYIGLRGNKWSNKLEKRYDPYFGLDWTRNLAYMYASADNRDMDYRDVDVNDLYFNTYVRNVGYPLKDLKSVLYELAVKDPEYFYLGSINMITENPPGLRKHVHVIVGFPYIDYDGDFKYLILSRNRSVTLKELEKAYPGSYVHLVKVKASPTFVPPGIKFDPVLRRLF